MRHSGRLAVLVVAVALAFGAAGRPVAIAAGGTTETYGELWRSRYGNPGYAERSTQVGAANSADGTAWLLEGANVTHLASDGTLLFRSEPLHAPYGLVLDTANGSVWVSEGLTGDLLHFSADGALLSTTPDAGGAYLQLTPSPADGSVWVTCGWRVTHVSAAGEVVWSADGSSFAVVADPHDGSAWVGDSDTSEIVRLAADGSEMWRVPLTASHAAEDTRDQSLWVVGSSPQALVHLSASGEEMGQAAAPYTVRALHVSPVDGAVWAYYSWSPRLSALSGYYVSLLDSSGTEVQQFPALFAKFNDSDGSVWLDWSSTEGTTSKQVSTQGEVMREMPSPAVAAGVAYDSATNSFWQDNWRSVQHIGPDGSVIWQDQALEVGDLLYPAPEDDSCWMIDAEDFVRLSPDGQELARRPLPTSPYKLNDFAISPTDGSWYVGTTAEGSTNPLLLHLAADGTELWRSDQVGWRFSLDESDGSVWSLTASDSGVNHLASDGTQLASYGSAYSIARVTAGARDGSIWLLGRAGADPWLLHLSAGLSVVAETPMGDAGVCEIAVLPSDGSVYAAGEAWDETAQDYLPRLYRLSSTGALLWEIDGVATPMSLAVDPRNGSLWAAGGGCADDGLALGSVVVHVAPDGTELWRSDTFNHPVSLRRSRQDHSVWLVDALDGQIVHLGAPPICPFTDVPAGFWAEDAVVACLDAGVVTGLNATSYWPTAPVTRAQMAVFIARALAGGDAGVATPTGAATFADVPADYWAFRHIEYCARQGVVAGYGWGYGPEGVVNRAQMAVFVARAIVTPTGEAGLLGYTPPLTPSFPDVASDYWAYKHIEYCKAQGIVAGYGDGYHPEEAVTRDQMAVYVARAFELPM
jgi:hypothetical protein